MTLQEIFLVFILSIIPLSCLMVIIYMIYVDIKRSREIKEIFKEEEIEKENKR